MAAAKLDALRECDEGDELYARMILGDEEISYGAAIPPTAKVLLISAAIGETIGCVLSPLIKSDNSVAVFLGTASLFVAVGIGGAILAPSVVVSLSITEWVSALISFTYISGLGSGMLVCNKITK